MSLVKLGKQETLNTAFLSQQLSSAHTVHTEQQAASITAECQAGSCRSQANPTGVGRQEEKIRIQVPSPSTSCIGSCPPSEARAHTHTPEAFVFLTEHSFLPFSQGPGRCDTICEGPRVHHITALETGFCLSPSQSLYPQAPDCPAGHFTGMISTSGMTHRGNFVPW